MLNPVVGYADYGTDSCGMFREALKKNLRQELQPKETCLALDPTYWWSSWFTYYEKLLRPTIRGYAAAQNPPLNYLEALNRFSTRLAIIELLPYYSRNFQHARKKELVSRLLSSAFAKAAAEELKERASKGEALVVVRWASDLWGLKEGRGVVRGGTHPFVFDTGRDEILKWLEQHPQ